MMSLEGRNRASSADGVVAVGMEVRGWREAVALRLAMLRGNCERNPVVFDNVANPEAFGRNWAKAEKAQ